MFAAVVVAVVLTGGALYYSKTTKAGTLTADAADAYTEEVSYLLGLYHNQTGTGFVVKGGGSYTLAREIGEGEPVDLFFSVSLQAYEDSYMGSSSPAWAIALASDQMVIAYSNATLQSPSASSVVDLFKEAYDSNSTALFNESFTQLTSGKYRVGVSNPNSDPAGARAWLLLEMASYLYSGHGSGYYGQRMISFDSNRTASNAAELVAPLEQGEIQFLFIYRSSAIAKHLGYISLPPQINMGSPLYANFYSKFTYNLASGAVSGAPIYLYVSVPSNAPDRSRAEAFVVFCVSDAGYLSRFGLTPLAPALLYNSTATPPQVSELAASGHLTLAGKV